VVVADTSTGGRWLIVLRTIAAHTIKRGPVEVWDLAKGVCARRFHGHERFVYSAAMDRDGRLLTADGNSVRLWDIESTKCLKKIEVDTDELRHVRFVPGTSFAVGWGSVIRVWDLERGACVFSADSLEHSVTSVSLSTDTDRVFSIDHDLGKLWDTKNGICLRTYAPENSLSMSPNHETTMNAAMDMGASVALVGVGEIEEETEFGHIELWDLKTGEARFPSFNAFVSAVCLSVSGRLGVTGDRKNRVMVWDVEKGDCLNSLTGHSKAVTAVCIGEDEHLALSGDEEGVIHCWNIVTGKLKTSFGQEGHAVESLSISPDGRYGLSASKVAFYLWEIATGHCVRTFGHPAQFVRFSENGKYAVSAARELLRLWDLRSGKCICTFEGHIGTITSLDVDSTSSIAVSGGADNSIQLWRLGQRESFYVAPPRLCKVVSLEALRSDQSKFQLAIEIAERALQEGNFQKAAASVRQARAVSGFRRDFAAVDLWRQLCGTLRKKSFCGAWPARDERGRAKVSCFDSEGRFFWRWMDVLNYGRSQLATRFPTLPR